MSLIRIRIDNDIKRTLRQIDANRKQQRVAAAIALTKTVKAAVPKQYDEMRRVFDRPTRYTLNSLHIRPATPSRLVAEVGLKDRTSGTPAAKFLDPQIQGGARRQKGFERLLSRAGVLRQGWLAVPARGARLDAHGNVSRGQLVQILSVLRAFSNVGFNANITERSRAKNRKPRDYFVSGPVVAAKAANGGRLPFGIYERKGRSHIVSVFLFVSAVRYRKRYRFQEINEAVYHAVFPRVFQAELQRKPPGYP